MKVDRAFAIEDCTCNHSFQSRFRGGLRYGIFLANVFIGRLTVTACLPEPPTKGTAIGGVKVTTPISTFKTEMAPNVPLSVM
jgi:hypothetical protein